jgi:hypothetical protein
MRDKYYQLVKIPSSDDYLNNADGLRRAASPEEITAAREKLESRLSPKTANSSASRELSATQSREQQQKLASIPIKPIELEKLPIPDKQESSEIYYKNLLSMIDELRTAQQGLEEYSESNHKDEQSPSAFHEKINTLIAPYPFQDFILNNAKTKATENELAESYLGKEKEVLKKLLGYEGTDQKSNPKEVTEYLIHQARIVNILKTIDKSELNLRLSFINHYLQASFKQIMQVEDPIAKEAIFEKTVKFLNTNLIPDSLPSKEKETAEKYIRHLNPVIHQLKKINEAIPEPTISNENSLISALKTFVIKNIEEHCENLIRIDNLSASSKIDLFKNYNLLSISSPTLSQQERIIKTLDTTDKTDINFRLALINLYLENNVKEIKNNEKDPIVKKAIFEKTVKFLDTNLIPDSLLPKEAAETYIKQLNPVINSIKEINDAIPEPTMIDKNDDSILASKTSLIKNIEEYYENLIRSDNLSASNRIDLFKNNNLLSILSPILSPQQRIEKTLNTTDRTDINFRLALINLYLENNVKEIETNKEDKETRINKFQETVKFLDIYLLTLESPKSTKQASDYIDLLKPTLIYLKALQKSFPENEYPEFQDDKNRSQRSPNDLVDIVTKQAEKIIETSYLTSQSKSDFLNNINTVDILSENTIKRLNNHLLEYLLNKKDFSISSRQGSTLYPEQTSQDLNPEYQFLSDNKRGVTYDKNILNQVLIQDLGKSITDNPLFFKFLELMIDNTPEHFQKLQNNALSVNSREDFKTSVLKYLNSATGEKLSTAANKPLIEDDMRMIKSLQALMLFEDKEIQQSSKGFYLKALQETKFPETLGTILTQLKLYQNFTGPQTGKSLPINLEDLNNSLQFSPVIKTIELKQLLEKNNVKELKKDAIGEFILSEHPVTLTETEKNILNELEQVRANLLARQQPPLEP